MYFIPKSTTGTPLLFMMVQSSDHITALTGASPTVTISKNGGSFASPSGSVTEIANGWYQVAGNATDTGTAGPVVLHATAASGDPVDELVAQVTAGPLVTSGTGTDQLSVSSGNVTLSATGSAALTESYAADGAAPTLGQAIYQIMQFLHEKSVSTTTMTVKKLDGSTSAMTFTLNDASAPTSITRAS